MSKCPTCNGTGTVQAKKPTVAKRRCAGCGSLSGHHAKCDRAGLKLPKLTIPKPGTATHAKLVASVMKRIGEESEKMRYSPCKWKEPSPATVQAIFDALPPRVSDLLARQAIAA